MARRNWIWSACLGVLGAGDLALSIHAHATWHPGTDGPQAMTLGQLLGFVSSIALLLVAGLVLVHGLRLALRRRRFARTIDNLYRQHGLGRPPVEPPA